MKSEVDYSNRRIVNAFQPYGKRFTVRGLKFVRRRGYGVPIYLLYFITNELHVIDKVCLFLNMLIA